MLCYQFCNMYTYIYKWYHTMSRTFKRPDDVIQWKQFPRYWPFVRGIHRWPVNSPHKGPWRGALMFSLIFVWVNNREACDLRRHRAHYDVIVMGKTSILWRFQVWAGRTLKGVVLRTGRYARAFTLVANWGNSPEWYIYDNFYRFSTYSLHFEHSLYFLAI